MDDKSLNMLSERKAVKSCVNKSVIKLSDPNLGLDPEVGAPAAGGIDSLCHIIDKDALIN